jgi:hypothetical protein
MASKIDPELAKSLIKEFRDQNQASGENAWKTPDGHYLNGFYLERGKLEEILKDEKVAGIHVYFAKHKDFVGKPDKVHSALLTGAIPNPDPKATKPFIQSNDVVDDNPPCPPVCS